MSSNEHWWRWVLWRGESVTRLQIKCIHKWNDCLNNNWHVQVEWAMGFNLIGTRTILCEYNDLHKTSIKNASECEFHLSVDNQLDSNALVFYCIFLSCFFFCFGYLLFVVNENKKPYSSFSTGIRLYLVSFFRCWCVYSCCYFLCKSIYDCNVCVNNWMAAQYQWLYSDLYNCRSLKIAVYSFQSESLWRMREEERWKCRWINCEIDR